MKGFYFHHLGSTSSVSNRAGKIHQQFDYLPTGEIYNQENFEKYDSYYNNNRYYNPYNILFQGILTSSGYSAGDRANPNSAYRFNGKEIDENTGLYYYGARYYDPTLSQFLSVDPLCEKFPHQNPYAYCSNNPLNRIDPTGMEDVIYLVNLQKDKKVDANALVKRTNEYFESLGLNTRMVLAPDGKNFNPAYMDKTDSYAVLGSVEDIKNFIKSNDGTTYNNHFAGWEGGVFNPERSSNTMGQKTNAIGLDANSIPGTASSFGTSTTDMASFLTIHSAGHNANLNHSDSPPYRNNQNVTNATIMGSGNYVFDNGINTVMQKGSNSVYIRTMNQYFGGKPANNNYNYNKMRANEKVRHY